MRVGKKLVVPVVAGAAFTAGRRGRKAQDAAVEPYPQGGASQGSTSPGSTPPGSTAADRRAPAIPAPAAVPGVDADTPTQIPAQGWKQIVKRSLKENKDDNVPLLAAGVAFYLFLALFPAIIAAVSLYGIVADKDTLEAQVNSLTNTLPRESAQLIADQMRSIVSKDESALGLSAVISILGALFAASGGVANLMKAINLAYDEEETRGFLKLRATALLLTLGGIVFFAVAVGLVAVLPVVLQAVNLGAAGTLAVNIGRWVALVVFMIGALAVMYRYGPDRDNPQFKWVGLGSLVATVLWVIGSIGFSLYVTNFGKYGETYGALAGVVVLMLWLFLTSFIVLFGAEINSETEHQTAKDTTEGPDKPLGERGATMADTVVSGT